MDPIRKKEPKRSAFVFKAVMVLLAAFLFIVGMFYLFSLMLPSLMGRCVAVVDINYPLTVEGEPSSLFSEGYPSSEELAYTVRSLNARDDVGAVVFVVNSGGGSVVASGEIYDSIEGLDKPSVAYFREVAASGAYYVVSGADYIISDPNAITGSIGVITEAVSMAGLFDKLGINATSIVSGSHKDIGSSYRNMTVEEHAILQALVDEVFQDFRSTVIANRGGKLDSALFEQAMDGRIMTGRQAVKVGLVDATGRRDDAILKAAGLAGMPAESADQVRVCHVPVVPREAGMFSAESFVRLLGEGPGMWKLKFQ